MRGKSKRGKTLIGAFTRARDGAVLVVVAVLLFVLAGAVALSVDLGRAWNLDTQLQDGADACALAAASQLDKSVDSRKRAIEACADATKRFVKNRQSFATDKKGAIIVLDSNPDPDQNEDFIFWSDLGDPALGRAPVRATGDEDAGFVQVLVRSREVGFYFASAVGAVNAAAPSAVAVAGLKIAQCQSQPMFFCNPYDNGFNPPFDIDSLVHDPPPEFSGTSIVLDQGGKDTGNPSWQPGNFGLLAVPDCSGKQCLFDQIWAVNPDKTCFGEYVDTETGQATNLRDAFNVRFDIYAGESGKLQNKVNAIPARNTVKGLKKEGSKCTVSAGGWVKGANPYEGPTTLSDPPGPGLPPELMGYPRDKCQFTGHGPCTAPGNPPNPQDRFGNGDWDIETYMAINHPGDILGMGGVPGPDATRFEVYQWELMNPPWSDGGPEVHSEGGNVCNTLTPVPDPPNPNRRLLKVAVLNCISAVHDCDASKGESITDLNCKKISDGGKIKNVVLAKPDGWLRMFLLEPMGVWDSDGDGKDNNDFVAEVYEPGAGVAKLDDPTNRYVVQLYPVPQE